MANTTTTKDEIDTVRVVPATSPGGRYVVAYPTGITVARSHRDADGKPVLDERGEPRVDRVAVPSGYPIPDDTDPDEVNRLVAVGFIVLVTA